MTHPSHYHAPTNIENKQLTMGMTVLPPKGADSDRKTWLNRGGSRWASMMDDRPWVVAGGTGLWIVTGGSGQRSLADSSGQRTLAESSGLPTVIGDSGPPTVAGGFGPQTVAGGSGPQIVSGGSGPRTVSGDSGLLSLILSFFLSLGGPEP